MRKYDTVYITECVEYLLDKGYEYIKLLNHWKQFRNCQAWYTGSKVRNKAGELEDIYILQSYWSVVALYNKTSGELVKFDWTKYENHSRTTNKQITQWARSLGYGQ